MTLLLLRPAFLYIPVLLHVITWVLCSKYKAEQSHLEEVVLTNVRKKTNSFSLSGSKEVKENDGYLDTKRINPSLRLRLSMIK